MVDHSTNGTSEGGKKVYLMLFLMIDKYFGHRGRRTWGGLGCRCDLKGLRNDNSNCYTGSRLVVVYSYVLHCKCPDRIFTEGSHIRGKYEKEVDETCIY